MPENGQLVFARRFYTEGKDAYGLGVESDANPYWYFTKKREDWQRGFEDARKEAVAHRVRETDTFLAHIYYSQGWQAYQEGHGSSSPYLVDEPYTPQDYEKHGHWKRGYEDAERSADPDGLVPRMGDITGLASFRPSGYTADTNVPRERLFSVEKAEIRYTLFTAAFKTEQRGGRLTLAYIQARNVEEAVGILFVKMGDQLGEKINNWVVNDCPVQGPIPQLTFGQKGIHLEED